MFSDMLPKKPLPQNYLIDRFLSLIQHGHAIEGHLLSIGEQHIIDRFFGLGEAPAFTEMKGPGDSLRDNQRGWMKRMNELDVPAEIWRSGAENTTIAR